MNESSTATPGNKATGGAVFPVAENGSGNSAISSHIQATTGSVHVRFVFAVLWCQQIQSVVSCNLKVHIPQCPTAGPVPGKACTARKSCCQVQISGC